MLCRIAACLIVPSLFLGCASVTAGDSSSPPGLCSQSRTWDASAPKDTVRILPTSTSEENGRIYKFDLDGRSGLRSLRAECGWASYSECNFRATQEDGQQYDFSDLSTFALWEHQGALYLLYRVVSPKSDADARKRRLIKVGNPPVEVCSQIDYTQLM